MQIYLAFCTCLVKVSVCAKVIVVLHTRLKYLRSFMSALHIWCQNSFQHSWIKHCLSCYVSFHQLSAYLLYTWLFILQATITVSATVTLRKVQPAFNRSCDLSHSLFWGRTTYVSNKNSYCTAAVKSCSARRNSISDNGDYLCRPTVSIVWSCSAQRIISYAAWLQDAAAPTALLTWPVPSRLRWQFL